MSLTCYPLSHVYMEFPVWHVSTYMSASNFLHLVHHDDACLMYLWGVVLLSHTWMHCLSGAQNTHVHINVTLPTEPRDTQCCYVICHAHPYISLGCLHLDTCIPGRASRPEHFACHIHFPGGLSHVRAALRAILSAPSARLCFAERCRDFFARNAYAEQAPLLPRLPLRHQTLSSDTAGHECMRACAPCLCLSVCLDPIFITALFHYTRPTASPCLHTGILIEVCKCQCRLLLPVTTRDRHLHLQQRLHPIYSSAQRCDSQLSQQSSVFCRYHL